MLHLAMCILPTMAPLPPTRESSDRKQMEDIIAWLLIQGLEIEASKALLLTGLLVAEPFCSYIYIYIYTPCVK